MAGTNVTGMYCVSPRPECFGFIPGTGSLKVWGYYPYLITDVKIFATGSLFLYLKFVTLSKYNELIGELGTEHHGRTTRTKLKSRYEFFNSEEEAIAECNKRNTNS
jgi:hypothetical protein